MAKRKIIRKSNRPLNIFADGGQTMMQKSESQFSDAFKGENLGGTIGGIGSAVGSIANAGIQNAQIADTSGIEGEIKAAQTYKVSSNNYDDLMNEWSTFSPVESVSWRDIRGGSTGQRVVNTLGAVGSGAGAGASVGGPIGAVVGGIVGLGSAIGGWLGGNRKAKKKAKELNKQSEIANAKNLLALEDRADSIDFQNDLLAISNYFSYGGLLGMGDYNGGAIDYELANENLGIKELNALNKDRMTSLPNSFQALNTFAKGGKIHIKKANRGKFTEYCGGKVTSECIAKGKRSSNPAVRKRATFAANARKWKHAFGGDLLTNGVEWSNGLKTIDNGGTHEDNPMEGVPMGIAPDGQPNLVEEGEVIYNNYVFSNRMFADKKLLEDFKLPKAYDGYSFAAIAERLGKESKERPNDPISKRGLMSSMTRLQQAQETMRQKGQVGQEGKEYAHGGKMGILFDGEGDIPNLLGDWQDFGVLDTPITTEELESMMEGASAPTSKDKKNKLSYLRYAPILGSAIGLGYNIFKKPDYSGPDAILEAAEQVGNYTPVRYNPIGNYLTYRPLDRNYYINKLNAQAGATRRAILNTTSPSRNAALLAADYNALGRLGDLSRQAEEYNLAQRERVEGFNRQTNMANSEMGLKASMSNQEAALKAKSQKMSGVAQAYAMRDAIDARRSAGISTNLTNLFDSLGNVGKEEFAKDMIENNPALLYDWLGEYKGKKSKGGYLTVKKRRR